MLLLLLLLITDGTTADKLGGGGEGVINEPERGVVTGEAIKGDDDETPSICPSEESAMLITLDIDRMRVKS